MLTNESLPRQVLARLAARFRSRVQARGEHGSVGVVAMGIMLLLLGTSIAILGAAKGQIITARASQDFNDANMGVEDAYAAAIKGLNDGTIDPTLTSQGDLVARDDGRGQYRYAYDATKRTLSVTGIASKPGDAVQDTGQTQTLPLRWLNVGSKDYDDATGGLVYGVAANGTGALGTNSGIWSYGLATAGDSTVHGIFTSKHATGMRADFDYAILGGATTIQPSAGTVRAIQFSDSGSISGVNWTGKEYRSKITLQYDLERLRARAVGDSFTACVNQPPTSGILISGSLYCAQGNYTLPSGAVPPSTGVTTIVVRGDLTLPADITTATAGQFHFYVTGKVKFTKPTGGTTQKAQNVFIYAPSGSCSVTSGQALELTGAMACKSLDLPSNNNRFTYVLPSADTTSHAGASTQRIFYTESAEYVDYYTP